MTLNQYIASISDKKIAVVGIGVSNLPLIRLLARSGCSVTACDKRTEKDLGETYEELSSLGVGMKLGADYLKDLDFDIIFRTPGLHPMFLREASRRGALVTSEMEAFFSLCPCRIIAVTGSDGKTTTTSLIAELLKQEGHRVHIGGNIGHPLLCDLPEITREDFVVLELSSFQLHSMACRPDVAVITNVSPNHLDVHPDYEDYQQAKKSIFSSQTENDRLVLNYDNEITRGFAAEAGSNISWFSRLDQNEEACYVKNGSIYLREDKIIDTSDILLPGEHNVENLMAAIAATEGYVSKGSIAAVAKSFAGVEHRLELVRELHGVRYYNDSIASSPSRTVAGLKSFDQKVILIAGGHDKNISFEPLARQVMLSVKKLFLSGETQEKIRSAVEEMPGYDPDSLPMEVIDDFRQAVLSAAASAEPGDIVILSPACSSFDKFKNFVERGNTFKKIVEELE